MDHKKNPQNRLAPLTKTTTTRIKQQPNNNNQQQQTTTTTTNNNKQQHHTNHDLCWPDQYANQNMPEQGIPFCLVAMLGISCHQILQVKCEPCSALWVTHVPDKGFGHKLASSPCAWPKIVVTCWHVVQCEPSSALCVTHVPDNIIGMSVRISFCLCAWQDQLTQKCLSIKVLVCLFCLNASCYP